MGYYENSNSLMGASNYEQNKNDSEYEMDYSDDNDPEEWIKKSLKGTQNLENCLADLYGM